MTNQIPLLSVARKCLIFALLFLLFLNSLFCDKSVRKGGDCQLVDYLVVFNSFYLRHHRQRFINHSISNLERYQGKGISFSFVARSNDAYWNLPSDFEIVRINVSSGSMNVVSELRHPFFKQVHLDRVIKLVDNSGPFKQVNCSYSSRRLLKRSGSYSSSREYPQYLREAAKLHNIGENGQGVSVAIFDTGLTSRTKYLDNVKSKTQWTDDHKSSDLVGHGSVVASVIASNDPSCPGVAPAVDLHILKVFNKNKVSRTSWFLDAFNYILSLNVDIINLSIGGPDYEDKIFVDKVSQVVARGIVFVSAIGNDGPVYGTLNNPADQMEVIGVGAIDSNDVIAGFSSRGMTTWELPMSTGRIKPDIVTLGTEVRGYTIGGVCVSMQGTSMSSPIVTGSVALLLSAARRRGLESNPAWIKQLITDTASKVPNASMCEQGGGKLQLVKAFESLRSIQTQITVHPPEIDMTDSSKYSWPFNAQPLYYDSVPMLFNFTISNSLSVASRLKEAPIWSPQTESAQKIAVEFDYPMNLWPWYGYLGLKVWVLEEAKFFSGIVSGLVRMNVSFIVGNKEDDQWNTKEMFIALKLKVVPTPKRDHRILWDQFHSLKYPAGYFPRDDLSDSRDMLDWHSDHVHTNFKSLFERLISARYYIETWSGQLNCFDASKYRALLIVDPEEMFSIEEIKKVYKDVTEKGLSLIVVSDWWNREVMEKIKYFDENTQTIKLPLTGGTNVPSLNDLLAMFGIGLSNHVYYGFVTLNGYSFDVRSAGSILNFPQNGWLIRAHLKDQSSELLSKQKRLVKDVPIGGVVDFGDEYANAGSVALLTDSSCIEDSRISSNHCLDFFLDLTAVALKSNNKSTVKIQALMKPSTLRPLNMYKSISVTEQTDPFFSYSRVMFKNSSGTYLKPQSCQSTTYRGYAKELIITGDEFSKFMSMQKNLHNLKIPQPGDNYSDFEFKPAWSLNSKWLYLPNFNIQNRSTITNGQEELTAILYIVSITSVVFALILFRVVVIRKRRFRAIVKRFRRYVLSFPPEFV
ncbi:membrane-bound transcription factor site-1 protease-like [Convolutriloba macropyga]|uniref:membrane-bound transcription factor site-1 protease-like n=1 Tax=Convolutriloba macropyga TaxID=536237 RepID=UPI003F521B49